jgi:EmrB/QacA subfamily drug resistance transporter
VQPQAPDSAAAHAGWAPLLAICLGTFMLLIDVTIVNVALPQMAVDLHTSFASLQWVVDIYALTLAALLMVIGSASDGLGRRRTYIAGLVVFTLASLVCGLAPSEDVLVGARAVQGAGAAAMFATTIALINVAYTGRARGVAFGIWGATNGAAAAAGPIVGGLLTQGLSWRWVFFVNVPIGMATVVIGRRSLRESRREGPVRVDWPAGVTFTVAAASATYALLHAQSDGWTSPVTLSLLGVAGAGLVGFVLRERHTREPMFDLALLRGGPLAGVLVAATLYTAVAFAALIYTSIWLQTILGLSPVAAGLVTLPLSALSFVVAAAGGRVLHDIPARLVLVGGLLLLGVGDLLEIGLGGGSSWPRLLPGMAILGIGVGAMSPVLASAAMASVPAERGGMAAGAVNTARQLGFALGIAILGGVFVSRIGDHLAGGAGHGRLADAAAGGGAQAALAAAPPAMRAHLDASFHVAVASALGATFAVAGLAGLAGAVLVWIMMRDPSPESTRAR